MKNKFRRWNKSLLVNIFMDRKYKLAWNDWIIPEYDNINNKDKYKNPILIMCCQYRNILFARLLLSHPSIDVNIKNSNDDVALMYCCDNYRNIKIGKLLLQNPSIDVNAKDKLGYTALDYAMINEDIEMINLLKQNNAKTGMTIL